MLFRSLAGADGGGKGEAAEGKQAHDVSPGWGDGFGGRGKVAGLPGPVNQRRFGTGAQGWRSKRSPRAWGPDLMETRKLNAGVLMRTAAAACEVHAWRQLGSAKGAYYESPGQRPGKHARIQSSPERASQPRGFMPGGLRHRFARPFRALGRGDHFPGRCPGLSWFAPSGRPGNRDWWSLQYRRSTCALLCLRTRGLELCPYRPSPRPSTKRNLSFQYRSQRCRPIPIPT